MHYECWLHSGEVRGTLRYDRGDIAGPAFCSAKRQYKRTRIVVWKGAALGNVELSELEPAYANVTLDVPRRLSSRSEMNEVEGKQLSDRVLNPVGFDKLGGMVCIFLSQNVW